MSKKWLIIEKIIGAIITTWGMIALYNVTMMILMMLNYGSVTPVKATYLQIFEMHHLNILLSLGSMFAGALLIFNDKEGWLISIIISAMYTITFIMSSRYNSKNANQPYFEFHKSYSLTALLFLAIFILLIQKPFRQKYKPTQKNWIITGCFILILVIDKIIF